MERITIEGNTYPVRERLKALGCRWDAKGKTWYATDPEVARQAQQIVQQGARSGEQSEGGIPIYEGLEVRVWDDGGLHVQKGLPRDLFNAIKRRDGVRYWSQDDIDDFGEYDARPGWVWSYDEALKCLCEARCKVLVGKTVCHTLEECEAALEAQREARTAFVREQAERQERKRDYRRRVEEIFLRKQEWPEAEIAKRELVDYEELHILGTRGQHITGSGEEYARTTGHFWHIVYYGMDGDDWSRHNWNRSIVSRVPRTPELDALIDEIITFEKQGTESE